MRQLHSGVVLYESEMVIMTSHHLISPTPYTSPTIPAERTTMSALLWLCVWTHRALAGANRSLLHVEGGAFCFSMGRYQSPGIGRRARLVVDKKLFTSPQGRSWWPTVDTEMWTSVRGNRTRGGSVVSQFSTEGRTTTSFLVLLAGCMLQSEYAVIFYWTKLVACESARFNGVLSGLLSSFLTQYFFAAQTCVRDCSGKALFRLPLFNFLVPHPPLCARSPISSGFILIRRSQASVG